MAFVAQATDLGLDKLTVRAPLTDPAALAAGHQALLRLVLQDHTAAGRGGKHALALRDNFPQAGHCGELDRIPLLQFAPQALAAPLKAIGIHNLCDFLLRVMFADSRALVAEVLGLPLPLLLLAGHRAELLDLPVRSGRAKLPHLKDVLLLARLGLRTVPRLGAMAKIFADRPEALALLADAVEQLQRQQPTQVGRSRITRHDLLEWARAAAKRGSSMQLAALTQLAAQRHALAAWAAEGVLDHALHQPRSDAQQLGDLFTHTALLLARWQVDLDRLWWQRLQLVLNPQQAEQIRQLYLDAGRIAYRRQDGAAEGSPYQPYVAHGFDELESGLSLLTDLEPWLRPAERAEFEGALCFFVEPAPALRRLSADSASSGGDFLAELHLCMDCEEGGVASACGNA